MSQTEPTTEEKIKAYTAGYEACRAGEPATANPHGFKFIESRFGGHYANRLTHFWECGWMNGQTGLRGQSPGSYAMEMRREWR